MTDIRLALMTGVDIPIPECQLTLHQPRIKEISMLGEKEFFTGAQCLCVNKNLYVKDESVLDTTTNFQIFMMIMMDKQSTEKKIYTKTVLELLFPKAKLLFTPRSMMFQIDGENLMVDDNNFNAFQEVLKQVFCVGSNASESFNPGNAAAKAIADKLMRARQRVAAQKAAENQGSTLSQYLSILTVGLHSMSLSDLTDLTLYQLYDLVERYYLYVNWDLDARQRLAGAKPDSKPDNWMKSIH